MHHSFAYGQHVYHPQFFQIPYYPMHQQHAQHHPHKEQLSPAMNNENLESDDTTETHNVVTASEENGGNDKTDDETTNGDISKATSDYASEENVNETNYYEAPIEAQQEVEENDVSLKKSAPELMPTNASNNENNEESKHVTSNDKNSCSVNRSWASLFKNESEASSLNIINAAS